MAKSYHKSRRCPKLLKGRTIPLPFPSKLAQARKFEIDNELLQTFSKIPKYAKFLKELCINKRKKLKGYVEVRRNVSALIKSKQVSIPIQSIMRKKCSLKVESISAQKEHLSPTKNISAQKEHPGP
ncbi:hypothetical protein CR513_58365, partial [Mucuna pruriens]